MNRNWMTAAAVAAVVAIVLGAKLGRELLSDDDPPAKPAAPSVVQFHETVADVSLSFPTTWRKANSPDPEVPLLAVSPGDSTGLQMRRSATELEEITRETLPVAKEFTDPLFRAIKRAKLIEPAAPVEFGGLLGWRYRYTLGGDERARDQYFLFKPGFVIQLVFEVEPASRLNATQPQIDRIVRSLRNGPPSG